MSTASPLQKPLRDM